MRPTVNDASRPIKTDPADEEATVCKSKGIKYTEFLVANDGISLVVNKENDWAKCLTVDQLAKIWGPDSKVSNWNQVDPSFPDEPLKLFGPGTDSGTFDFFTGAINGEEGASRSDYTASEDDNVHRRRRRGREGRPGLLRLLVLRGEQGQDEHRPGRRRRRLRRRPSVETVQDGTYTPLSRPLFIYVKNTLQAARGRGVRRSTSSTTSEKVTGAAGFVPPDGLSSWPRRRAELPTP